MSRYLPLVLLTIFFAFTKTVLGQACSGSLGDPVFEQRFPTAGALPAGSTTYTFVNNQCPSDGSYSVRPSTTGCFGNTWHTVTDRTPGGGTNIMVVNAANTAGEFFKQTVTGLCLNTQYEFSAWVINLLRTTACTSNPNRFPNLTFRIETGTGTLVRSFTTGNITSAGVWEQRSTTFTSPANTLVLRIINNAPGGCGNDLALDDIAFRPCGGTTSATVTSGNNVCVNTNTTLTGIATGFTNPVYQWQVSTNQTTWTNISGATTTTLSTTSATAGTYYYRILVAETGNIANTNCRIASTPVNVVYNAYPAAPTASSVAYCQNASTQPLTAIGSNLRWYQAQTGGTSIPTPTPSSATVGSTTYYVSQTVNGCESVRTPVTVTINSLPTLTLTASDVTCNSGTSGSIKAESSGGTPGYEYSLDGGAFQTGNLFANLSAGNHTVTLRDSRGCTDSKSVTIAQPNPISLIVETSNNCATPNNGVIVANGAGGTGALQYAIDGGAYSSTSTFQNLTAGSHTVSVRDANGCIITSNVTVNALTPLSVTASGSSCITGTTGTITLAASGGKAAYSYSLNGSSFQASNTFINLAAGAYSNLTIRDSRGCTATTNYTISSKPIPPSVNSPVKYCFNASATPLAASGSNLTWYTTPTGGTGSSTAPTPSTTVAGSTNFYVSQTVNGCESGRAIIVAEVSSDFTLTLSKKNACSSTGGSITATATGGTSPFTYAINGGSFDVANQFSNLGANTYTIQAKDGNGCEKSQQITLLDNPVPSVSASAASTCVAVGGGSLTASGSGGTSPYEYKLNSGDYQSSTTFTGLNPGEFTVTLKDANGCLATTTLVLKSNAATANSNSPTCDQSVIDLFAQSESATATYSWTGPNSFTSTAQNPRIPYTSASLNGTYTVVITDGSCQSTADVVVQCNDNVPFPVTLLSFNAQQVKEGVLISWYATEQIQFKGFELERSNDAKSFQKLGYLPALPDALNQKYQFTDELPRNGINYYRLKQLDIDGTTTYSRIVAVNFFQDGEYAAVVNPYQGNTLKIHTNIKSPDIQLFDVLGSNINFEIHEVAEGFEIRLPFTYRTSTSFIRITGKSRSFMQKLLKID